MPRCWFVWIGLLTCLSLPGCLPREQLNVLCEWTESDRRPLDLSNRPDHRHLNRDVDIAIEVIMRSADAEHGRHYGYSAHGGYVDGGGFRDACREKVFAAIADVHIAAIVLCRIWTARFSPDEQTQRLVAFAITSLAASIAGVQLAVLWFNIAEMIRIGNDHLGTTRAFPTTSPYLLTMFGAGLLIFSFAALRQYRLSSS